MEHYLFIFKQELYQMILYRKLYPLKINLVYSQSLSLLLTVLFNFIKSSVMALDIRNSEKVLLLRDFRMP
jgi:hypothetical protein